MAYRLAQVAYAMAPAYAANMAPALVKYWPWWNRPIDRDLLGAHKTIVGFTAGVTVAVGAAYLQRRVAWSGDLIRTEHWFMIGMLFGIGAMGGDALKSLVKRRIGIPPGGRWIPADQLDFIVGALALVWPFLAFTWTDVLAVLGLSFAGHIAVDHAAYNLHIRDSAW